VFLGVRDFRDETIPVWREIVREAGKTMWKSDEHGYKVESQVNTNRALQLEGVVDNLNEPPSF
jgi:hypothetical protein